MKNPVNFIRHIILTPAIVIALLPLPCLAKGHGGGHGGGGRSGGVHGGGHSGYGSAGSHPAFGNARTTSSVSSVHTAPPRVVPTRTKLNTRPTATAASTGSVPVNTAAPTYTYGYIPGYGYPEYMYNPYYGYAYNPMLFDPFMFGMGFGYMYSPSYSYAYPSGGAGNYSSDDAEAVMDMPGVVVFEGDTLRGKVSVTQRSVNIETVDAKQKYDYVFPNRKEGLKYVTIYNSDSSQLNLVRLEDDPRSLYRVVHEGKLNIYDARHSFIYHPEDIDFKSMVVVYDGATNYLQPRDKEEAKVRLTQFVNRAYNMSLDARNFSWKELLVYIDKLD